LGLRWGMGTPAGHIVDNPGCERNDKSLSDAVLVTLDDSAMSAFVLALLLLPVWVYLIGTTAAAAYFARRRVAAPAPQPPVSVLKPLHGDEPGLYEICARSSIRIIRRRNLCSGSAAPPTRRSPWCRR